MNLKNVHKKVSIKAHNTVKWIFIKHNTCFYNINNKLYTQIVKELVSIRFPLAANKMFER